MSKNSYWRKEVVTEIALNNESIIKTRLKISLKYLLRISFIVIGHLRHFRCHRSTKIVCEKLLLAKDMFLP